MLRLPDEISPAIHNQISKHKTRSGKRLRGVCEGLVFLSGAPPLSYALLFLGFWATPRPNFRESYLSEACFPGIHYAGGPVSEKTPSVGGNSPYWGDSNAGPTCWGN